MTRKAFVGSLLLYLILLWGGTASAAPTGASGFADRPELGRFIEEMVAKHGLDPEELNALFSEARSQPSIIAAITRPAEAKPWHQYRPIFVTRERINDGVAFWQAHRETLERASQVYSVPPEIIVAIIGVETRFGKNTGSYRVLDALTTLAFDYPARSAFFRRELEQYLLLAREERIDPLAVKGSYAGAMGKPQFMPSSYRHYAVDFDGDGQRDLWNNDADAIGSVANYFRIHGWKPEQPVTIPVQVDGEQYKALLRKDLKPSLPLRELARYGVSIDDSIPQDLPGVLIELQAAQGPEYWVGLDNFYVITRYNRSALYAMAVYQLSQEILAAARQRLAGQ